MKTLIGLIIVMGCVGQMAHAQSKNRIDLDDMMIKGEIHNDDRLMILARQKNELKNYVKFRTNFREEILQELPAERHKQAF
jgi:tRNA A37 methylthiotransferase MiaB